MGGDRNSPRHATPFSSVVPGSLANRTPFTPFEVPRCRQVLDESALLKWRQASGLVVLGLILRLQHTTILLSISSRGGNSEGASVEPVFSSHGC